MTIDPKKLKSIFLKAIDLPTPEKRAAFVDQACGRDLALRKRLEGLLHAHDREEGEKRRADDSISPTRRQGSPRTEPIKSSPARTSSSRLIAQVIDGRYRIVELLGEGSTGAVFLAEEQGSAPRRVVLKVIRPGLEPSQVLARFEQERDALTSLDHAHVARVFHAGLTEQGRAYVASEYVDGLPLSEYCDTHRLTLSQRLRLFLQICDGVQHAHQKGLVHRDLRPGNILIGQVNDLPVAKIIDFGLARAMHLMPSPGDGPGADTTAGNPQYLSPELVGGQKTDIDTRSDIYSLGVVLYELLTGSTPLKKERIEQIAAEEAARLIEEGEFEKPSTRLRRSDQVSHMAALRRTGSESLIQQLRGDLDAIVLKAIQKDRTLRYASADALAQDIKRYLDREPVSAIPPTFRYRLGKFVRRHPGGVALASLLVLLLLVGVVTAALGWVHALAEAKQAQADAAAVQAQVDFLSQDLLKQLEPDDHIRPRREFEGNTRLVDALDRAANKVGDRIVGQPLVEANLRFTLGRTYYGLGEYAKARQQFERAEELRRIQLGGRDASRLAALHMLAHAHLALGDLPEAEKAIREVITLRTDTLGPEHPDTLRARFLLASIWLELDRFDQAEREYTAVWRIQRRVLPSLHRDTLLSQSAVADTRVRMGKLDDAEKLYLDTLSAMGPIFGADHPVTLATTNNLAMLHVLKAQDARGKGSSDTADKELNAALSLLEQTVADGVKRLGPNHSLVLQHQSHLAQVHDEMGQHKQAIEIARGVLEKYDAALGKNHPDALKLRKRLGVFYLHDRQYAQAESLLLETWKLVETLPDSSNDQKSALLTDLIILYQRMQKPSKVAEWEAVRAKVAAEKQ